MRRAALIAAISVLAAAGGGCGGEEDSGESRKGPGTDDFEVRLPRYWTDVTRSPETEQIEDEASRELGSDVDTDLDLAGPEEDGFSTNLNVAKAPVPGDISPEELARLDQRGAEQLYERDPELRPKDATPFRRIEIAGAPAVEQDASRRVDGVAVRQRQVYVVHDGSGYVMVFTAPPDRFDRDLRVYREIVASWEWR